MWTLREIYTSGSNPISRNCIMWTGKCKIWIYLKLSKSKNMWNTLVILALLTIGFPWPCSTWTCFCQGLFLFVNLNIGCMFWRGTKNIQHQKHDSWFHFWNNYCPCQGLSVDSNSCQVCVVILCPPCELGQGGIFCLTMTFLSQRKHLHTILLTTCNYNHVSRNTCRSGRCHLYHLSPDRLMAISLH